MEGKGTFLARKKCCARDVVTVSKGRGGESEIGINRRRGVPLSQKENRQKRGQPYGAWGKEKTMKT